MRFGIGYGMRWDEECNGLSGGCMVLALAFGYEVLDIDRSCAYGVWSTKRSVGARLLRYTLGRHDARAVQEIETLRLDSTVFVRI